MPALSSCIPSGAEGGRMIRAVFFVVVAFAISLIACADTVVTKDGRRFVGDVTKTESGYSVKTKLGEVRVSEGDFKEWVKGNAVASVTPGIVTLHVGPAVAPGAAGGKQADPKSL